MDHPRAYEGSNPYIFVSYSHQDSDTVLPIISALQERGFRVWYDAGIEAGTEWPEYIAEHLDGCSSFLAFMSKHAADSHNCRREINFAIKLRKEPLVVYLEEVEMSLGMQMQLDSLQAMFMYRHSSQEPFLEELCRSRVLAPCRSANIQTQSGTIQQTSQSLSMNPAEAFRKGKAHYDKGEYEEAIKWYRKSAEQGYSFAQTRLGDCYRNGKGVLQDCAEAVKWYRKSAEQGYSVAQTELGDCYRYGKGVLQDCAEAVKWYRKAAEQGYSVAQTRMGDCYRRGEGVLQDCAEAVKWYRKSAEEGYSVAQTDLGDCYHRGEGVLRDYAEAVKWYRKAAEEGYSVAQTRLGDCYRRGEGVSQDDSEAVKWYRKAAVQGHSYAQNSLKKMGYSW